MFTLHLFAGLVCELWIQNLLSLPEQRILNYYLREGKGVLLRMSLAVESLNKTSLSTKLEMEMERQNCR